MRQIPRLFHDEALAAGPLRIEGKPAHYLAHVLRLGPGAEVRLFDDQTGEWRAEWVSADRRGVALELVERVAPREAVSDIWLLAAPIRPERFQWTVEKATEMGVARIVPVLTERVQHHRQNPARLRAHMIEAAEQCGRTALPQLAEPVRLDALLAGWDAGRTLLLADEGGAAPLDAPVRLPAAVLIGPEGGFSDAERASVKAVPSARAFGLGPRILRADTAAVAALAQAMLFARAD